MSDRPSQPRGGGFLIALAVLVGAGAGVLLGEGSAGLLAGLAIGIAAAVLLWRRERS